MTLILRVHGRPGSGKERLAALIAGYLTDGIGLDVRASDFAQSPAYAKSPAGIEGPIFIEVSEDEKPSPEPFGTYCEAIGALVLIETNRDELGEELGLAFEAVTSEDQEYRSGLALEALDALEENAARLRATIEAPGDLPTAKCGKCCACFHERSE